MKPRNRRPLEQLAPLPYARQGPPSNLANVCTVIRGGFDGRQAAAEEEDEHAFAPLRRCARCNNPNPRARAKYCRQCGAAASRRWRARHAAELRKAEGERQRTRGADLASRRAAYAYLHVYIKRGKVAKRSCFGCFSPHANALIPDLSKPLIAEWWCAACRRQTEEDRQAKRIAAAQERAQAARQAAWVERRDAALAAIEALPIEERAALEDLAARGPLGMRLSVESPLYMQQLVRVYTTRYCPPQG